MYVNGCYFSAVHCTLFLLVCVLSTGVYLLIFIILCDLSQQISEAYKLTNMFACFIDNWIGETGQDALGGNTSVVNWWKRGNHKSTSDTGG